MTTPNLDALAKLAPFGIYSEGHGGDVFCGDGCEELDPHAIAAALNEWAELRKDLWSPHAAVVQENARLKQENADLRTELDRTESALRDVSQLFRDGFRPNEIMSGMKAVGLWREPGQGAT